MRQPARTLLAIAALGLAVSCSQESVEEAGSRDAETEVKQAFEDYRAALISGDGAAATDLVTQSTVDYYEEMGVLAATAGQEEIQARSLADQITIVTLRIRPGPEELETMDGAEVLAYSIEQGFVEREGLKEVELGQVRVSGETATAPILDAAGRPVEGLTWEFRNESGGWKLDVAAIIPTTAEIFEQQVAESGLTPEEFVLQTVNVVTGQRIPAGIWEAPTR